MSNKEVSKVVMPYYEANNVELAAKALIQEASIKWQKKSKYSADDITCIVIFI